MAPTQALTAFHLYLLGSFLLERNTRTLRLPTRKAESLLAYLALFPKSHSREQLAALFWGDSTDEQARHSLRTALAAIRKELGDMVLADRETVQLNSDVNLWVDASQFSGLKLQVPDSDVLAIDHLRSKIENYSDLLPDFYDDWVVRERERLRALYINALLQLTQHYRSTSNYSQAAEFARKVLASEPTNEKAHQYLMFCLAAQGDRIAALKQYDECKKILHDELNAEPSSDTTALRDQIMMELTSAPSREAAMTNLPNPLTSFIGREKEIEEIKRLLTTTRLLTLTGAGGCGKTRLAIQVVRHFVKDDSPNRPHKHGVWWVELANLSDPALAPQAVTRVLGVQESSEHSLTEMLTLFIRDKPMLVLLDNCEHLIAACAELAERLLLACPNLIITATSREALNVTGEIIWRVPSLAIPDADAVRKLAGDDLVQYDSIKLFVQRATASEQNWKLHGNAATVAHICTRLDGIPLAIELAAARVRGLSVQQIAERLDDRLDFLTGTRGALFRQHTLRGTIDWSYDLLSEKERTLFRRLAAFVNGWTLPAAVEVCSGDAIDRQEIIDLMLQLIDKSLVVVTEANVEMRYHFLETMRQYAQEKLMESGEAQQISQRHLTWFVQFANEADSNLRGPNMSIGFKQLDAEFDNCRAALDWAFENGRSIDGVKLNTALVWYMFARNHYREAIKWSEMAERLTRDAPVSTRADALFALGVSFADIGEYARAEAPLQQALALYRGLDNRMRIGWVLNVLGVAARRLGKPDQAKEYFQEALTLRRAIGDTWGITHTLQNLANLEMLKHDYARAKVLEEEGLKLSEELGDQRMIARRLTSLGDIAYAEGDMKQSVALVQRSIAMLWQLKERFSLHQGLEALASVIATQGQAHQAAQILGAIEFEQEEYGVILSDVLQAELERTIATIREQLGDKEFARAWNEGRAMTMEQTVELALAEMKFDDALVTHATSLSALQTAKEKFDGLTAREREVAALIAQGKSNREIAERLVLSERTIEGHVRNILNKLAFNARTQIAAWAVEKGIHQIATDARS